MRSHHFAAAVLALALTAGCEASDRPGTIVGQLFVVLQSGNSAPMDVRPVRLVPESARLDSTLSVLCIQRDREVAKLSVVADSILAAHASDPPENDTAFARVLALEREATVSAMRAREEVLNGVTLQMVHTRPDFTFVLDSVPPGQYRLWSDADLKSGAWHWLVPVKVRGGDTTHISLNNSNPDDNPLKCPTPLGE
jgi:hypothetical protein